MLALGVLAVSCTVGTPETGYNEDGTLAKIVNAPLCCDNVDGILVKFKDFLTSSLRHPKRQSGHIAV